MKANELMIGDWVTCSVTNKYHKVSSLTSDVELEGDRFIFYSLCDDIEPIPLTAEILEKNGFGYKEEDGNLSHYYLGDGWYLDNLDLHIGTYNKGVYWLNYCDNAIHGIKYVHELQHALKLCGIEKVIEL